MFSLASRAQPSSELSISKLFNEETFYPVFTKDLNKCLHEVIIESPFVTNRRLMDLLPVLRKLKDRKVRVIINTRDPIEHDDDYHREDAHRAIAALQRIGVQILYTTGHHRKLALIDRQILYEGSLNVLSQNNSCEVMRRIESTELAWQMIHFIGIDKYVG